jgi:DNA-binding response OmpR family regulator
MKTLKKQTKILLVDDEPNILVAIEFLLTKEGYIIQKAFDGQQAIEKVDTFHPNIIILDVMMPGLDGFEVARRVRHMDGKDDIKIIFLTAKGTTQDKMKGYSTGGEYYLIKPFDNDELVDLVKELVAFG